jgi:hypothetical protein
MKRSHSVCIAGSLVGASLIGIAVLVGRISGRSAEAHSVSVEAAPSNLTPKAVLDETKHDFGFIDHAAQVSHTFVIRNEGTAPLKLERGQTTCKCTMSTLPPQAIPPGVGAEIVVSSKIEEKKGFFSHGAKILTNDPDNSGIELRIIGSVRQHLAMEPGEIVISGKLEGRKLETLVYSQVWNSFEIAEATFATPGLTWQTTPADAEALSKVDARSGYLMSITLPDEGELKEFADAIRIKACPIGKPDESREAVVSVRGEGVADEFGLFGGKMYVGRNLRIGILNKGEGALERLTMKFRGAHQNVKIESVEATPAIIDVKVTPYQPDRPELGLFRLDVAIPKDAPHCDHMGIRKGEVTIETDHPTRPTIKFFVEFAVLGH